MSKTKSTLLVFGVTIIFLVVSFIFLGLFENKETTYYTISFDSFGGSNVESQNVNVGKEVIKPIDPIKEGYNFIGWQLNGDSYDFTTKVYNEFTLVASWQKIEEGKEYVVVKFNTDGGTTLQNVVFEKGMKITEPISPIKEGYNFIEWQYQDEKFNFDNEIFDSIELVAIYEKIKISNSDTTIAIPNDKIEFPKGEIKEDNNEQPKEEDNKNDSNSNSSSTIPTKPNEIKNPVLNRSVIHFISTGSSDAILIESNGVYGLVDSSAPYNDGTIIQAKNRKHSVEQVIDYLNALGIKYLDFVIATHSHDDHIGGMPKIAKNFVNSKTKYYYRTYDGADDNKGSAWDNIGYYNRALEAMIKSGATLVEITNKTPTLKCGNFSITLLNTDKSKETYENYNSIGALVKYDNVKIFLSSDIEANDSNKIASTVGSVDILKLNHHGYSGASVNYLSKLHPKNVIITNNYIDDRALGPIAYLKENFKTNTYYTGSVSDAIRVFVYSNSYNIENSGATINLTESKKTPWLDQYIYLTNGKITKSVWIYDNKCGKWYYASNDGYLLKSWQQLKWSGGVNWFFFNNVGEMLTKWQKLNWSGGNDWFYFDEQHGYLYQDTCKIIDNKKYCFDKDGVCISGEGC